MVLFYIPTCREAYKKGSEFVKKFDKSTSLTTAAAHALFHLEQVKARRRKKLTNIQDLRCK